MTEHNTAPAYSFYLALNKTDSLSLLPLVTLPLWITPPGNPTAMLLEAQVTQKDTVCGLCSAAPARLPEGLQWKLTAT